MRIDLLISCVIAFICTGSETGAALAAPMDLYWGQARNDRIVRSDREGSNPSALLEFPQTNGLADVSIDSPNAKIVWVQLFEDRIMRADLDGSNAETLLGFPFIHGLLAITTDPVNQRIYWAQTFDDQIMRSDADGSNFEVLLAFPVVLDVVDIAIDPVGGKLYWAEAADGMIRRADLDGTNREDIIGFPAVSGVVAIAVDPQGGQLYWAQTFNNRIRRTDFTGTVVETVLETTAGIVDIAVDPDGGEMFWLQADDTLWRASFSAADAQMIAEWPDVDQPLALAVASTSSQECTSSICPAPAPHDIRKIRYLSVDPRGAGGVNVGQNFDIKLTLTSTLVNGVTAVGSQWWANAPDANCLSIVGPAQPAGPPNWDACPTLHLTGCPIIPTSTYDIVAVIGGSESGPPLVGETQLRPGIKWHGDAVGFFDGVVWTPPNGTTSIDDAFAALKTFQNPSAFNATHVTVTDVHPNLNGMQINKLVNIDDVFVEILGFQGLEYPGSAIHTCLDP